MFPGRTLLRGAMFFLLCCLLPAFSQQEKKIPAPRVPEQPAADTAVVADSTALKRTFNHKEQVIVGGAIMAGLALILVTMNNYNPE